MPLEIVSVESIQAIADTAPANGHHRPSAAAKRPQFTPGSIDACYHDSVIKRARAYLEKTPGAKQGEGGSGQALFAACRLVNEFALDDSDAFDLLSEWNAKCDPPWSEVELWHKIGDAIKKRDGNYRKWQDGQPKERTGAGTNGDSKQGSTSRPVLKMSLNDLVAKFPSLNLPVIDGLARQGETINIISVSKIGKSWLVYCLLICIITGRRWFGRFATSAGRVLLVDNELHASVLAHRIPAVAREMGVEVHEYADKLDVWSLRGNLKSLTELGEHLKAVEPGYYRAIVFDAKYRFATAGQSENDNAFETLFYNLIDEIAEHTKAAVILIHHASKGGQAEKRVTDVGSGAGAQSRAADCHLVLREHEEEGHVVLDAAVRSFAPVEPVVLKWQFPLWVAVDDADPSRLKGCKSKGEEQQDKKNAEADGKVLDACQTWKSISQLHKETGMGTPRCRSAANRLKAAGFLESEEQLHAGNHTTVFRKTIHAR